jgi:hypothetical protein
VFAHCTSPCWAWLVLALLLNGCGATEAEPEPRQKPGSASTELSVSQTTPERPVATFFSTVGANFLVWVGMDHRINVVQQNPNTGLWDKDKRTLPDTVRDSGGITVAEFKGRLFIGWNGTDARLNVISSADGLTWDQKLTLTNQNLSDRGPSLAAHGGKLFLAFTGRNDALFLSSLDGLPGSVFSPGVASLGQHSKNGPWLVSFSGHLLVSWTGTDKQLNIQEVNPLTLGPQMVAAIPESSNRGSSIVGVGSELVLGWTGTDERLNFAPIEECALLSLLRQGGGSLAKTTLSDTSERGAVLANIGGSTAIVWVGTDNRVNITEHVHEAAPDTDPDSSASCGASGKIHVVPK